MQTESRRAHLHTSGPLVRPWLEAGYQALEAGDHAQAEALFRRAVERDVRSMAAWIALAETQRGARRAICLQWAVLADQAARRAVPPPVAARRWSPPRRAYRLLLIGLLSTVGTLTALAIGSDLAYRERALPGVSIGSTAVGSRPLSAVEEVVQAQQQRIARRSVQIQAGRQTWSVPLSRLVNDQQQAIIAAVRDYGHEPSFWQRTVTRSQAMFGRQATVAGPTVNRAAVQHVVAALSAQISRPRRDAQLLSTEQGWTLIPDQLGVHIDQQAVAAQLTQFAEAHAWEPQTEPLRLEIGLRHDLPRLTAVQLEPALARLQQLQAQPLELVGAEQRWTLDRSMLMRLDTAIPAGLTTNSLAIEQELERIAAMLAVAPQPAQLTRAGDRIQSLVLGRAGRELDRQAAQQRIEAALAAGSPSVELPIRELPPPPGEAEQLGLIAELGRGESQFVTYSSPERDANVQTGGNDIDGRLIAPGEVFSFNQAVGQITEQKGYRWGEAIEAGELVPSLGGGICQVSTTAFRAAFWSGLEIVERHHHSWRLPWYEVDAPPGMDATIALGGPDLKFRNNTGRYVLIKVETDLERKRQTVVLYGTPDGRMIAMQSLSNGNIGVQRRVLAPDGAALDDTFVSYYSQ